MNLIDEINLEIGSKVDGELYDNIWSSLGIRVWEETDIFNFIYE